MKKLAVIAFSTVFVAALMLGVAFQANAQATRYEVSSFEYDCTTDWGTDWMEGNAWHIRGIVHENINISANPEMNGINTTVADGDFNLENGTASIRGTMSFKPDTIDGTWEGHWAFIANKGVYFGRAVAQGTGALEGQTLFLDLYDGVDPGDADAVCATVGGVPHGFTEARGYILVTGGK
jgi:hypothetical protein